MALLNIPEGRTVLSLLSGLPESPETQEAVLRAERIKTLREQKLAYLSNAKAGKEARFGYDVDKSVQENLGEAFANNQVYTDPVTGEKYQQSYINGKYSRTPFTGATRDLYIGQGQAGDIKIGLARNDVKPGYDSYQARYMDKTNINPYLGNAEFYDGTPGPYGVDPSKDKVLAKVTLPYDYATQLEYGIHTDIDMMKSRAMGPNTPESAHKLYGPGVNEYYLKDSPLMNDHFTGKGLPYVTKDAYRMTLEEPRYDKPFDTPVSIPPYESQGTLEKIVRGGAAGGVSVLSRLAQGVNGALGGLTDDALRRNTKVGTPDWYINILKSASNLFHENEKWYDDKRDSGAIDKFFNFHPEEIQQYGETFKNHIKKGDYFEAIKSVVTNPEAAAIAFSNSGFESFLNATRIGFVALAAANVNNDLYDLEQSAKAKGVTVTDKQKAIATGLSIASSFINAIGDRVMLGKVGGLSAVKNTFSKTLYTMPPYVKNAVINKFGGTLANAGIKTSGVTSKVLSNPVTARIAGATGDILSTGSKIASKAGVEGATEGIQEILQGKANNIDNLNNLTSLSDKEIDQALIATGIGLGAGGIGATASSMGDVKNTAVNVLGATKDLTFAGFNKAAEFGYNRSEEGKIKAHAKQEQVNAVRTNAHNLYKQSKDIDETTNITELYNNNTKSYIDAISTDENSQKFNQRINTNIINKLSTDPLTDDNIPKDLVNAQSAIDMIEDLYTQATPEQRNNDVFKENINKIAETYDVDKDILDKSLNLINQAQEKNVIEEQYGQKSYKYYGRMLRQAQQQDNKESISKIQNILNTALIEQYNKLNEIKGLETSIQNIKTNNKYLEDNEKIRLKQEIANTKGISIEEIPDENIVLPKRIKGVKKLENNYKLKSSKDKFGHYHTVHIDTNGNLDANTLAMKEKLINSISAIQTELQNTDINNNSSSNTNTASNTTDTTTSNSNTTTHNTTNNINIENEVNSNTNTNTNEDTTNKAYTQQYSSTENTQTVKKPSQKSKANSNNTSNSATEQTQQKQSDTNNVSSKDNSKDKSNNKKDKDIINTHITDTETQNTIHKAGFAKLVSRLVERLKNINVELTKKEGVRAAPKDKIKTQALEDINNESNRIIDGILKDDIEGVKNTLYSISNSTNPTISNLIDRFIKKFDKSSNTIEPAKNLNTLKHIKTEVFKALEKENSSALESLKALYGDNITKDDYTKAIKAVLSAIATVKDTMESTYNVRDNFGLINDNDKITPAPKQEVAIQLGKVFMNQALLRLAGESNLTTMGYAEIGEHIINLAIQAGFIQEGRMNHAISSRLVTEDNKNIQTTDIPTFFQPSPNNNNNNNNNNTSPFFEVSDIPSLTLTEKLETITDNTPITRVAQAFHKLFQGANLELPTHTPEKEVHSNYEVSENVKNIVSELQSHPFYIRPEAIAIFKQIKNEIDKYGNSFDKAINKSDILKNVLGLIASDAEIREASEKGKTIGKTSKLINLIENLDYIIGEDGNKPLYFQYDIAINNRIHVIQTVLDFQGDKFMGRQVLSGGTATIKNDMAKRLLISTVAEELGISPADVAELTGYKITINTNNTEPEEKQKLENRKEFIQIGMNHMQSLINGKPTGTELSELVTITKTLGFKSSFKLLSLLGAMNDIRNSKSGVITTSYPVEVDALASGIINTLLNLSGFKSIQKILDKLGIGDLKSDAKSIDPYMLIVDILKTFYRAEYNLIKSLMDELEEVGIDKRDLVKYAIIKWFYGQADKNNNYEMAKDIVENLIDKVLYERDEKALELVNKILKEKNSKHKGYTFNLGGIDNEGKFYSIDNPLVYHFRKHDIKLLENFYKEKLAPTFTKVIGATFADVQKYRNMIKDTYRILEDSNLWDGKISTPFDVVTEETDPKKASLTKLKQYVFKYVNNGQFTTYLSNKALPNETSAKVNPQHLTDAAILFLTLKDVMSDKTLKDIMSGIMTVHDAIYSNPEIAIKVMERYNYHIKQVALKYDFIDAMLNELKEVKAKLTNKDSLTTEEKNLLDKITKQIDVVEAENNKLKEKKEKYLKDKTLNVAGNFSIGKEVAIKVHNSNSNDKIDPKQDFSLDSYEDSGTPNSNNTKEEVNTEKNSKTETDKTNITKDKDFTTPLSQDEIDEINIRFSQAGDEDKAFRAEQNKQNSKNPTENTDSVYETKVKEIQSISDIIEKLQKYSKLGNGNTVFAQKAKEIKLNNIVELLESLDVTGNHKDILNKVIDTVKAGYANFIPGKNWTGGNKEITVPESISNKNLPKTINALVEILGHEVDHAVQLEYINTNYKTSPELRYLKRVIDRLSQINPKELSTEVRKRLNYILNPSDKLKDNPEKVNQFYALQISELSSVIMNEPNIGKQIIDLFDNDKKTIWNKLIESVKEFRQKVSDFFKRLTIEEIDNLYITPNGVINAILELDANARASLMNDIAEDIGIKVEPAHFNSTNNHEFKPLNVINDTISTADEFASDWLRVFGTTLDNAISPRLVKVHTKLKHILPLYKDVSNLLKIGFYDSEFGQKMHYLLGFASDTIDKTIKQSLTMFQSYHQNINKDLEFMAQMERKINAIYNKEDRIVIHRLFADTGIANLGKIISMKNELFSGTKNIDTLLKELKAKIADETKLAGLDEVANEMVDGISKSNTINLLYVNAGTDEDYMYTTLKAISKIDKGEEILVGMDNELRNWMLSIALANKELNDQINRMQFSITDNSVNEVIASNSHYSETYAMDMYENTYVYKSLTASEMRNSKYSSDNGWIEIHSASGNRRGLIARQDFSAGSVDGVGLGTNRFFNGAFLSSEQSKEIDNELQSMSPEEQTKWLTDNRFIKEDGIYRVLIPKQVKVEKLGLIQNAAQSLYQTYVHNKELIQTENIRQLILDQGTERITNANELKNLENILRHNDKVGLRGKIGTRIKVKPFVSIDYTSEDLSHIKSFNDLKQSYPMVAKYFKTADQLTSFNNFSSKISLVKRGVSDILQGHKNFSFFGDSDYRNLAQAEVMFKKSIILAKQKLIVTNPIKLAKDSISNLIILSLMGISIADILKGFSAGLDAYKEYAKERTKYANLAMDVTLAHANYKLDNNDINRNKLKRAIALRDAQEVHLTKLEFHDAFSHGFIQSYSTDLVIKEFDTIQGIQKDIDTFIDKYTHDKKGDPNKLFKAIKWWQNFGFSMDNVLVKMSQIASIKGTDAGTELIELAERLKNKKADKESVARYVSEYIGTPSSEIVNYGSAYMVLSDSLSKYILAKHLMTQMNPTTLDQSKRRLYTKEEAYSVANEVFIDYRTNLPAPIKALSDYGILLFPNFWIKVQKVLFGLFKYRPISSATSLNITTALNATAINPFNQSIINKLSSNTGIINNPIGLIGPEAVTLF